ncbi:TPA: glycosyltransferase, partial [Enterococcus faecalis]
ATKVLLTFKEENLFLRGMVPLVGFPSTKVYYSRNIRVAGESKYPLKKMLNFAMEGITSFSIVPIKMVRNIGFITLLIGIFYMIYSLIQHFTGNVEAGWSSLIISIWFLGGIQLISLSIVGEYIGKIYSEVKGRPRFIIEEEV